MPLLYYMMAQQEENQFITEEQQQRQYLIDLLAQKRRKNHREVARVAALGIMERVSSRIEDGIFKIQKKPLRVDELLQKKELSESMKRLLSNQKKMEEKNRQNQLLYPNRDKSPPQQKYPHNILSLEKHKEFVREIRLEKMRRESKMTKLKEREVVKKEKSFSELRQVEQQERMALIERRKAQIQQNLQKMRQNHEKLLLDENQTKQLVNSIRNKKRLHEHLKQTYQIKFVLPQLEENKKILEQRKENSKLSLQELQHHEKQYLEWKKSQQSLEKSSVSKTSYQPPPHSKKIMQILAEEERSKHTLEQQKNAIRQKMERVNNYNALLKEKRLAQTPTISKTIATTDREKSQKTEISRRQSGNRNNLGNKYLEQARKALRKRAKTQQGQHSPPIEKKQSTRHARNKTMSFHKIQPKQVPSIQRSKKDQIERMLDCGHLSPQQKLQRIREADELVSLELRRKEEKLKVRFSRKDDQSTVELLMAAVKAKMNLLHCYEAAP